MTLGLIMRKVKQLEQIMCSKAEIQNQMVPVIMYTMLMGLAQQQGAIGQLLVQTENGKVLLRH